MIEVRTLDLDLDGGDSNVNILVSLTNKAPGHSGALYALLANSGSIDGELDVSTSAVTNTESTGSTEYEQDVIGGAGVGELGGAAEIGLWLDLNKDGVFDAGSDIALKSDQTTVTTAIQWDTVNNYASKTWNPAKATVAPAADFRFYISWRIPTGTGNTIQGDSFTLPITFTLEQPEAD